MTYDVFVNGELRCDDVPQIVAEMLVYQLGRAGSKVVARPHDSTTVYIKTRGDQTRAWGEYVPMNPEDITIGDLLEDAVDAVVGVA